MKTRVAVIGASGRTGRHVVSAVGARDDVVLHAAVVSSGSTKVGVVVEGTSIAYSGSLDAISGADLVIDFTTPEVSMQVVRRCVEMRVPVLVGTTGHSQEQLREFEDLGKAIPLARVSNTSLGATVLSSLAREAKRLLGPSFDIEIVEIHHNQKKDAPSGTALMIAEGLIDDERIVANRSSKREPGEVGVGSLRGGSVAGDHTVYFLGEGERIELVHRVSSRATFGIGAVSMGLKLCQKLEVGIYQARDLIV